MASTFQFEKKIKDLEKIVEILERGDQPLEKTIQQYEKGVGLIKDCQQALDKANHKVMILKENELEPFQPHDKED
jgi:exodeoxyribonuclease VII small subunit